MFFATPCGFLTLCLFLCVGIGLERAFCSESNASAGWAEVEITPPLGIFLGGRGGPLTRAKKVLSPLFAQVTCLKDAKGSLFVLASFDLVSLPHDLSDRIRTAIVHETGAEWNLVVLNSSHTHSGPYMIRSLMAGVGPPPEEEIRYFAELENKIIQATRQAFRRLRPVAVEVFSGTSEVAINRRGRTQSGQRGIIPDVSGPFDEKVWVLKLTPPDGAPSAVIFSYACHPVIVYGFALASISPDFPGLARGNLKHSLGEKSHAQFVQGFAGNVRPRAVADLERKKFRASKPADLEKAGSDLAAAVLAALKGPGMSLSLDLAGTSDRPFLPRGEPPPRETYEKMRQDSLSKSNDYLLAASDYWLSRYDAHEGFAKGDVWSLGLIRLAENQWIAHSGGEPCVEWRAKISQWLKPLNIVTFGYSQEGKSYLPTEEMLPQGGYEVLESNRTRASTPAPYAPGIEEAVRRSLVSQRAAILSRGETAGKH